MRWGEGGDGGDKWGNRGPGRSRSLSGAEMSEASRAGAGFLRQSMVERLPRAASHWDPSAARLAPHLPRASTLPMQKVGRFGRMPLSYASAPRYAGSAGGIGRAVGCACPSVQRLSVLFFFPPIPTLLSFCFSHWAAHCCCRGVSLFFFAIYASLESIWISLHMATTSSFLSADT